jgi:hypothetical protein
MLWALGVFGFSHNNWVQDQKNWQDEINVDRFYLNDSEGDSEDLLNEEDAELESSADVETVGEPLFFRAPASPTAPNLSFKDPRQQAKKPPENSTPDFIAFYQDLYRLPDHFSKLVDNRGNGYENLYGVRNFRAVLNGVMYRSGANNAYNRNQVRNNQNPLPPEGLKNLCAEGFQSVIYMYTVNYQSKLSPVQCHARKWPSPKTSNSLIYSQISPWNRSTQYKILRQVYDHIQGKKTGPILIHCWNGWHASGLISALALRQFCEMPGPTAVAYWNQNTDGNHSGKIAESYRKKILDFQSFEDLAISATSKNKICFPPTD